MSTFVIKIIAIVSMLIDHLGLYLFPESTVLRIIGRISFALFAWLIANGAKHTKNINKYVTRLLVFGVISQIPYALLNQKANHMFELNVLFTLALGLFGIKLYKQTKSLLPGFMLSLLALFLQTEYHFVGVLSVLFFYVYFDEIDKLALSQLLLMWLVPAGLIMLGIMHNSPLAYTQPIALLALLPIYKYNGKSGPKAKWLFYIVYPLQFVIFYIITL